MPRGQSPHISLLEVTLNTASGFAISYGLGLWLFPFFGFPVSPDQNLSIVGIFTLVSILRSYAWRRLANWWHVRRA